MKYFISAEKDDFTQFDLNNFVKSPIEERKKILNDLLINIIEDINKTDILVDKVNLMISSSGFTKELFDMKFNEISEIYNEMKKRLHNYNQFAPIILKNEYPEYRKMIIKRIENLENKIKILKESREKIKEIPLKTESEISSTEEISYEETKKPKKKTLGMEININDIANILYKLDNELQKSMLNLIAINEIEKTYYKNSKLLENKKKVAKDKTTYQLLTINTSNGIKYIKLQKYGNNYLLLPYFEFDKVEAISNIGLIRAKNMQEAIRTWQRIFNITTSDEPEAPQFSRISEFSLDRKVNHSNDLSKIDNPNYDQIAIKVNNIALTNYEKDIFMALLIGYQGENKSCVPIPIRTTIDVTISEDPKKHIRTFNMDEIRIDSAMTIGQLKIDYQTELIYILNKKMNYNYNERLLHSSNYELEVRNIFEEIYRNVLGLIEKKIIFLFCVPYSYTYFKYGHKKTGYGYKNLYFFTPNLLNFMKIDTRPIFEFTRRQLVKEYMKYLEKAYELQGDLATQKAILSTKSIKIVD